MDLLPMVRLLSVAALSSLCALSITHAETDKPLTLPFRSTGACPFECCHYGKWVAEKSVTLYKQPNLKSEPVATLNPADIVTAKRGDVVTLTAGEVHVLRDTTVSDGKKTIAVRTGESIPILHSLGEGFWRVWLHGRASDLDLSDIPQPGAVMDEPKDPALRFEKEPETDWYVEIELPNGKRGWTGEKMSGLPFCGMDACGGSTAADCVRDINEQRPK